MQKDEWTASVPEVKMFIEWAPLFLGLAIGVYAASLLVAGVVNFRDCPEAATELEKQVYAARKEMKRRGVLQ